MMDVMYKRWPVSDPKAVLLLVHGLGAHTGRWEFLAGFFAGKGFSSYAIELKGFGVTTDQPRGHIDSFKTYYQDILKLLSLIKKENPEKKVFLLGESMGGLISFMLAGENPREFSGLILISPAFKNAMKFTKLQYADAFSSLLYNQKKMICIPFTLAMCTRDLDYVQKMEDDPRELRCASSKMLFNILAEGIRAKLLFKRFQTPCLFLIPGKDLLIDEEENKKVFSKLGVKDKTLIEYPEMLHALSIEFERERVFQDILSWLEKRL